MSDESWTSGPDLNASFLTQQTDMAALHLRNPIPQVLAKRAVNNSTWTLLFRVPQGTHVELQEILTYNGDAAARSWRMALTSPEDTNPAGSAVDTPNVFASLLNLASGDSNRKDMSTGLAPEWGIWFWSDAAVGKNFNISISGQLVTFL